MKGGREGTDQRKGGTEERERKRREKRGGEERGDQPCLLHKGDMKETDFPPMTSGLTYK
jgi:hypothetical protein